MAEQKQKNTVVQNEKQTQIQKKQELSYRQQIACQPKKTDWEAWLTSFGWRSCPDDGWSDVWLSAATSPTEGGDRWQRWDGRHLAASQDTTPNRKPRSRGGRRRREFVVDVLGWVTSTTVESHAAGRYLHPPTPRGRRRRRPCRSTWRRSDSGSGAEPDPASASTSPRRRQPGPSTDVARPSDADSRPPARLQGLDSTGTPSSSGANPPTSLRSHRLPRRRCRWRQPAGTPAAGGAAGPRLAARVPACRPPSRMNERNEPLRRYCIARSSSTQSACLWSGQRQPAICVAAVYRTHGTRA